MIEISKNYDKVIVGLHKSDKSPFGEYKFTDVEISMINDLKKPTDLTLVVFSKPYSIFDLNIDDIQSILIAYQNSPVFQEKAAQAIFGAINVKGKLPVTINKDIPVNTSIKLKKKILSFKHHLNEGFSSLKLKKVDSIVDFVIKNKMTPGVQLLIAKNGSVF